MIINFFSSFRCYVHYCMIKRKFFFILLLRSLRYDQEKKNFFFIKSLRSILYHSELRHFGTTFNTPWSQEKKLNFYCTTTLTTLRSIKKKIFFHFNTMFTMQIYSSTYYAHTSLTYRKSLQMIYSPEKHV